MVTWLVGERSQNMVNSSLAWNKLSSLSLMVSSFQFDFRRQVGGVGGMSKLGGGHG